MSARPSPAGLTAPRIGPVRHRRTFDGLRERGHRGRCGPLSVTYMKQTPSSGLQIAYAVGRTVGTAVARNRLRRRLRAVVGHAAQGLPPGAYLVGAGPGAARLGFDELKVAMRRALERATAGPESRTDAGANLRHDRETA